MCPNRRSVKRAGQSPRSAPPAEDFGEALKNARELPRKDSQMPARSPLTREAPLFAKDIARKINAGALDD